MEELPLPFVAPGGRLFLVWGDFQLGEGRGMQLEGIPRCRVKRVETGESVTGRFICKELYREQEVPGNPYYVRSSAFEAGEQVRGVLSVVLAMQFWEYDPSDARGFKESRGGKAVEFRILGRSLIDGHAIQPLTARYHEYGIAVSREMNVRLALERPMTLYHGWGIEGDGDLFSRARSR